MSLAARAFGRFLIPFAVAAIVASAFNFLHEQAYKQVLSPGNWYSQNLATPFQGELIFPVRGEYRLYYRKLAGGVAYQYPRDSLLQCLVVNIVIDSAEVGLTLDTSSAVVSLDEAAISLYSLEINSERPAEARIEGCRGSYELMIRAESKPIYYYLSGIIIGLTVFAYTFHWIRRLSISSLGG